MSTLVTPAEAAALQDGGAAVVDVQYELMGTPSTELYAAGHVPGATHLSLDAALAGPPGPGGRHPLPDPGVLQDALRQCGIREGQTVVAYDQRSSLAAARAWWVLRWAGLSDVRVLDGGLDAWRRDGREVATDPVAPALGTVTVRAGSVPVLDAVGAARVARAGVLLDSRAAERFRGESEPIDPVAGHIPGARSAPMAEQLREDGTFRSPEELRAYFSDKGARAGATVGTSCGSGVTAAHTALALHVAGVAAIPYIGSWSHWVTDPARPVATGD